MSDIVKREITDPFNMLDDTNQGVENNLERIIEEDDLSNEKNNPPQVKNENVDPFEQPIVKKEDVEEEEEVKYDVKLKGNLTKYFADLMKTKGHLPSDFEIKENITEEELNEAYLKFKEEPLKNQLLTEVKQKLAEEEGLSDEMLREIKLKHYGVQDENIQKLQVLNYFSNHEFDPNDDDYEKDARIFLTSYYGLKNLNQKRVEDFVKRDLEDDSLMDIIEEAQKEMGVEYNTLKTSIENDIKAKADNIEKDKKETKTKVDNLLSKGLINNVQYTAEETSFIKKALFDKTEIVEIDGKSYRTTLYNKKKLEAKNNIELDLEEKILFLLSDTSKKTKNREREKVTRNMLGQLNEFVDIEIKKNKKDQNQDDGIVRKLVE